MRNRGRKCGQRHPTRACIQRSNLLQYVSKHFAAENVRKMPYPIAELDEHRPVHEIQLRSIAHPGFLGGERFMKINLYRPFGTPSYEENRIVKFPLKGHLKGDLLSSLQNTVKMKLPQNKR
ncbi:hypothetical protein AWB78_08499 [Caballeronia calidae]|uniref:Uncharacterized protein n=1 Tax=Caballeronia calidae TaxID=1777139 RepID=A0A158EKC5_9BURK|nr:hypothetical protein AWB78_08499 [Caballeronia calidae]